jgi:hypothetical protein
MNTTRYIIVLFSKGIGYTLQIDNSFHAFFNNPAKSYKRMGSAINMAKKLINHYCLDQIYVFRVELNEELSCQKYNKWCNDEARKVWMFSY